MVVRRRKSQSYTEHDKKMRKELGVNTSWFGWLVGFNGISTSIGYLMPEPFYTYIIYMIRKGIFLGW